VGDGSLAEAGMALFPASTPEEMELTRCHVSTLVTIRSFHVSATWKRSLLIRKIDRKSIKLTKFIHLIL
jgi:hypothetical protein